MRTAERVGGPEHLATAPRGACRADAVRVLVTAAVAAAATVVLLSLIAWAAPHGRPNPTRPDPLLAAIPVLATVAVLTAVGARLGSLHRVSREGAAVAERTRPIRGPAAAEAATAALVGVAAGVQAYLVPRALVGQVPDPVRRLLSVGEPVPWPGVLVIAVLLPAIAASAAAFTVRRASARVRPRVPPYAGPLLLLSGLLTQYLVADPAHGGPSRHGTFPAAVVGYATVVGGAALTVPWLVTWCGAGWAPRARHAWSLCAARRIEASARGMSLPMGLIVIAVAIVTTNRFAGARTAIRMSDAPLLAVAATVSVCAAAILFTVIVEYGAARRETSRELHAMGATGPVDRRAALVALAGPIAVCVVTGVVIGALAAWPAGEGGPFPTVSSRAAGLGTAWAGALLVGAVLAAGYVILRDEGSRARRRRS